MADIADSKSPQVHVEETAVPPKEAYRNYKDSAHQSRVSNFYLNNHRAQTYDVVKQIKASWTDSPVVKMTIIQALDLLDTLVDQSDPDTDAAQVFHAYQTAERARELFPELTWLHVAGLIHDAGKALGCDILGCFPQEFLVGDTFPQGCKYQDKIVFHEYFAENPDAKNEKYQTELGIYEPKCGLSNVQMSFGHDEYLYQVLVDSNTTLPEEALYIVRFHSFYAHHQHRAYQHLMNDFDEKMFSVLKQFQPCDLYSKTTNMPPIEELRPYYAGLLKYYGLDQPLLFRKLTLPASVSLTNGSSA